MVGRPNEDDAMNYAELFAALHAFSDADLAQAAAFYDRCPDGQWDELASLAIRAILVQRQRDHHALMQRISDIASRP